MRRLIQSAGLACGLVVAAMAGQASAQETPAGLWRCSAQGNIPIGLLTITGANYRFQAVNNSLWALKPQDSMNGSGGMRVAGTRLTPSGGPLASQLQIRSGVFGHTGRYSHIDFFNDPASVYVLRCHRP